MMRSEDNTIWITESIQWRYYLLLWPCQCGISVRHIPLMNYNFSSSRPHKHGWSGLWKKEQLLINGVIWRSWLGLSNSSVRWISVCAVFLVQRYLSNSVLSQVSCTGAPLSSSIYFFIQNLQFIGEIQWI